jgi:pentatricopeptide repeat protein
MLRLLEMKEFTRALNHWRALEREGHDSQFTDEKFYAEFLQSACRVGKTDVCERLLQTMKKNGMIPSVGFWQSLLKMFSSRRLYTVCLQAYDLFRELIPADRVAYSCLINAALECNQAREAVNMLQRYREADLDVKDYILFFRAYTAAGDLNGVVRTFRELKGRTTTLMLNLLLLTFVNEKKTEDALTYLKEAKVYEQESGSRMIDTVSYNTLIKGFAELEKPERCFDVLQDMRSHGLEPDDVTFGSLLDVCIADNDINKAHTVIETLMHGDRPMDTIMCTLFIKGFVRVGNLAKAVELYEHMKMNESAAQPDVVTYSVLVKALVESRNMERALLLVEDMVQAGHQPDDIILTHLLEGCRHIGNQPLGKKLFEDMLARGVKPSEFTLMTLVKLNGRCGMLTEARELIETWESQHGQRPTVIHYTCLMSGCIRAKDFQAAWDAYELMCKHGVLPDETTFATMIPGMANAKRWENVLTLATRAVQFASGPALPADALNAALAAMLNVGQVRPHAQRLYSLMQRAHIPVTVRNAQRRLQTVDS